MIICCRLGLVEFLFSKNILIQQIIERVTCIILATSTF